MTWGQTTISLIIKKYETVSSKATSVNGDSAGQAPSQVNSRKLETRDQNRKRETGENMHPLKKWFDEEIEKRKRKETERSKPMTPPSLLGIERKIA